MAAPVSCRVPRRPQAWPQVLRASLQVPPVWQVGEGVVFGQVPELQRAFFDAMLEVRLVGLDDAFRCRELASHVIERIG